MLLRALSPSSCGSSMSSLNTLSTLGLCMCVFLSWEGLLPPCCSSQNECVFLLYCKVISPLNVGLELMMSSTVWASQVPLQFAFQCPFQISLLLGMEFTPVCLKHRRHPIIFFEWINSIHLSPGRTNDSFLYIPTTLGLTPVSTALICS